MSLKESWDPRPLSTEETELEIWVLSMERNNGRHGLKILTTKKMPLPSRLRLDLHTCLPFRWRLPHTPEKNSRTLHPQLLSQSSLKVSREARPLLTEEMDNLTWVSLMEKSSGRHGLRTSTIRKMPPP